MLANRSRGSLQGLADRFRPRCTGSVRSPLWVCRMSFTSRLNRLGFSSYAEYLSSDRWIDFRSRYRASSRRQDCLVCHNKRVHLHHRTYKRLGCERFADVVPLCEDHHNAVHDWLKTCGKSVESTDKAIKCLIRSLCKVKKKKDVNHSHELKKKRIAARQEQQAAERLNLQKQEIAARLELEREHRERIEANRERKRLKQLSEKLKWKSRSPSKRMKARIANESRIVLSDSEAAERKKSIVLEILNRLRR